MRRGGADDRDAGRRRGAGGPGGTSLYGAGSGPRPCAHSRWRPVAPWTWSAMITPWVLRRPPSGSSAGSGIGRARSTASFGAAWRGMSQTPPPRAALFNRVVGPTGRCAVPRRGQHSRFAAHLSPVEPGAGGGDLGPAPSLRPAEGSTKGAPRTPAYPAVPQNAGCADARRRAVRHLLAVTMRRRETA